MQKRSGGPRTPEGKAVSSQNAVRHGLSSAVAVLPFESQEEFNALVSAYIRDERPRTENEIHIVRGALCRAGVSH